MTKITTDFATHQEGMNMNGAERLFADKAARNEINKIFTDFANVGGGLGTCSTEAGTAAKTATLENYLLLKNVPVSIFFENAISVAGATLNINSQGAKPIYIGGNVLQPGVIRPRTTVTFVYDGTRYNVTGISGLEQSDAGSELWVDMGLPSGVLWAKKNIDVTQADGFAASEFQYECSFVSWGNTDMYNPTSSSAFDHNWGTANETEPYASSPGARLTGNIAPSQDAARANLGAPWRMPITEEYAELFAYVDFVDADGNVIGSSVVDKRVSVNGIMGIYMKSKINGNLLFFPCSGHGHGASWNDRGSRGLYWSSSLLSATHGRYLNFLSGGVLPQFYNARFVGFSVRAVQ